MRSGRWRDRAGRVCAHRCDRCAQSIFLRPRRSPDRSGRGDGSAGLAARPTRGATTVRLWFGYGSEHSMNLVMIGRFKDASDATLAKQAIDRLTDHVNAEVEAGRMEVGQPTGRYDDAVSVLLGELAVYSIGPAELEQFAYSATVSLDGTEVVLETDEIEVSAVLKVLIDKGARVEVFSAHDNPDNGHGPGP